MSQRVLLSLTKGTLKTFCYIIFFILKGYFFAPLALPAKGKGGSCPSCPPPQVPPSLVFTPSLLLSKLVWTRTISCEIKWDRSTFSGTLIAVNRIIESSRFRQYISIRLFSRRDGIMGLDIFRERQRTFQKIVYNLLLILNPPHSDSLEGIFFQSRIKSVCLIKSVS